MKVFYYIIGGIGIICGVCSWLGIMEFSQFAAGCYAFAAGCYLLRDASSWR
jgi:hypothetical protein